MINNSVEYWRNKMTRFNKIVSLVLAVVAVMTMFSGCAALEAFAPGGSLVINEVVSANESSFLVEALGAPDWIELYNGTDKEIDLTGYTILRTDATDKQYVIPSGTIAPGEYLVICATEAKAEECEYLITGFNLPKKGVGIKLKNANGMKVDELTVPTLTEDISYCRGAEGFSFCQTPTPGSENAGVFAATLEEVEAAEAPAGLIINEAAEEFVELYNSSSEPISLAAFCLTDNVSKKSKWRLPYDTLEPGEYLLISLVGEGEVAANFRLSSYETQIYLCYGDEVYAGMDLTGLWDGMSKGINAAGAETYYVQPTPGAENAAEGLDQLELKEMDDSEPVKITEFMSENAVCLVDEDGDRPAWAEIYNSSSEAVRLSEYYLSDDETNLLKWQLPDEELGAGEYAVIYLSGKDKGYHASFGVAKDENLILTHYTTLTSQTVAVPAESRLDNISYGVQDGKWLYFGQGTPGAENTAHGSESISNVEKVDRMGTWISEVSAAAPARSNQNDWIELYNGGDTAVDLNGWYLSDDIDQPKKYALKGTIDAKSYLVVTAGGKDDSTEIANFGISPSGEELILTNAQGAAVDIMETGALRTGVTSGRATGDFSGERVFFETPTKGEANAQPLGGQLSAPEFSVKGGFYESGSVTLELTAAEGDIYYTLDGSEPTAESTKYTGPITITKNTAVSAIAVKSGRLASDAEVNTYIMEEIPNIPTVCISIDDADFRSLYTVKFFTGQNGKTYVAKNIEEIERRCNIEYYETDGKLGTSFPCGIRVTGNGTRTYNQKSLAIFTRPGYGQSSVVYPFFEGSPITEFQSLVLRNAGQNRDESRMADVLASNLFQGMNLDAANSKFVVVFINGEYYGIYDLKEKINESYFESYYGVDPDSVNTIRRNTTAIAGTNNQVKQVYSYAQSWGTSNDETFAKFTEYVDQYAWADYIIARSYCGDTDLFNQKLWNTSDYQVKWRPIFFDCDFSLVGQSSTLGVYFKSSGQPSPDGTITNMHIGTALKRNEAWCDMVVERYAQILEWVPEKSLELFDEYYAQLEPEMERHIERWGTHDSLSEWKSWAQKQRKVLEDRPYVVVKQIQSVFGVSSERMKELFPKYYK